MAISSIHDARQLLSQAIEDLRQAGVASPEFDAWALLSDVLHIPRGELQAKIVLDAISLTDAEHQRFLELVARRVSREPLWRITGLAPFLDLELEVGPGVFTPRPETELLAHQAIVDAGQVVSPDGQVRVVDLCAGSGAIGIAVASAVAHSSLLAVEVSDEAAGYLERNLRQHVPDRHSVIVGDIQKAAEHPWVGTVDIVVSNPPYLIPGEPLDVETASSDPDLALFGGDDGLDVVRRVVDVARALLRSGGIVSIEHGVAHGEQVRHLLESAGFRLVSTERDLLGRDRYTRATRC